MLEKGQIFMVGITVEDFKEILKEQQRQLIEEIQQFLLENFTKQQTQNEEEKKYVYGLKGLAKILDVSKSTAVRIKASGDLDAAIEVNDNGRVRIDEKLAQKLYFKKKYEL